MRSVHAIFIISITLLTVTIYSCKNKPAIVQVTTSEVTGIRQTGALSGGIITAGRKAQITSRGVCWDTREEPSIRNKHSTNGSGIGNYLSIISGLKPGTTYYLRAYVITPADTLYGNIISFSTEDYGSVTDIEGNEYRTITIGNQTWMARNLKVTKYRDGNPLKLIADSTAWSGMKSAAYCWYKNDESTFKDEYGALYNAYSVYNGKLCPTGWHVPGEDEWAVLAASTGGDILAGGNLKEAGTSHWVRPNTGATDLYKFTGLPGGLRYSDGVYRDLGFGAYWWTSTPASEERGIFTMAYYQDSILFRFNTVKQLGFSVRCVKDN